MAIRLIIYGNSTLKRGNFAFVCIRWDFQLGFFAFKLRNSFPISLDLFLGGSNLNLNQLVYIVSKIIIIFTIFSPGFRPKSPFWIYFDKLDCSNSEWFDHSESELAPIDSSFMFEIQYETITFDKEELMYLDAGYKQKGTG